MKSKHDVEEMNETFQRNNKKAKKNDNVDYPIGSIMEIRLQNFLTYTQVHFKLGPSFNFILGPNGSGKSSLVAAICLGLGGNKEILSRAKELSGFVKHGADKALIEITLKGKD